MSSTTIDYELTAQADDQKNIAAAVPWDGELVAEPLEDGEPGEVRLTGSITIEVMDAATPWGITANGHWVQIEQAGGRVSRSVPR